MVMARKFSKKVYRTAIGDTRYTMQDGFRESPVRDCSLTGRLIFL
jgi:hypothetical protein